MRQLTEPLINSISVQELFGRRSYDLDVPTNDGKTERLLLLHGDNGSGKTTLLKLVWNALSAADNKGHRSYIGRTPFRELTIRLSGGSVITVTKLHSLIGAFRISIFRPNGSDITVEYDFDERRDVARLRNDETSPVEVQAWRRESRRLKLDHEQQLLEFDVPFPGYAVGRGAEHEYLAFLEEEAGTPLYLADDRTLYSDDPEIQRKRELLRGREDHDGHLIDRLARLVFIELQVAMNRVNDLIRGLTIGGQNDGSANSNAIYAGVLQQLANSQSSNTGDSRHDAALDEELARIAKIAPGYEEFGLVPPFDAAEFTRLLRSARQRPHVGDLAEQVLSPYLSSLSARYSALQGAHDLLQALIPTVNEFLNEKQLVFTPRIGLRIVTTDDEPLGVESLSSGERQLLMLLCTTIHARVDSRLFIIDEPELSLGVEWQRKIIDVLLQLTEGTGLQFLVATHSIEIISTRPSSLVQLRGK